MDRVTGFSRNSRSIHQTKHHLNRSRRYGGSDQVMWVRSRDFGQQIVIVYCPTSGLAVGGAVDFQ